MILGGLLALLLLVQAAPPTVTAPATGASVADFLARAQAVRKLGDAAAASPEFAAIKAEVAAITRAYRADLARQKAAGQPAHSCPPDRSGLTSSNLMADLNQVPVELRATTDVKSVYYAMMKKRYPCPF
ncbi:hypothetical protein [Sphingomonas cavernae]|uniref:Rap1a immunity protein domain-containing protein n=1 Tax=Sphingomonas cavernae TaxID=2320861 RepID=A0A418WRQ5_9SPHN|nr:hypothetical protein [Sphingomonas cavernae]RJF93934.1 hypothetical protein D3876_06585 [Sphingomonas cavernae]